jgi:DNA-directed RNA polymerase subunit M/transcription elongation factor TFIIS
MASPCPRCGAARTDPVPHGIMYNLVRLFGYRLHRCSQCRLPRFLPRNGKKSHVSGNLGKEPAAAPPLVEKRTFPDQAKEKPQAREDQATAAPSSKTRSGRCPDCGSSRYQRSHRTTVERLLGRPRMAQCKNCGARFPYPRHGERPPAAPQSVEQGVSVSQLAEERRSPEIALGDAEPNGAERVTTADAYQRGRWCCPACGSTDYRRSQRTALERILLRPRMARCRKCRKRFPYPTR